MPEPRNSCAPHLFWSSSHFSIAGCALFKNLITIKWRPYKPQGFQLWGQDTTEDELGLSHFFDDNCPTVRGFSSTCKPLTGYLLYARVLDVWVPAKGTWTPGALVLEEKRWPRALTLADRAEYYDREQSQTPFINFLLSTLNAMIHLRLRPKNIAL